MGETPRGYLMYELDLSVRDLPSCRIAYSAGGSYCAFGKLLKGLGLPVPFKSDCGWTVDPATQDFTVVVAEAIKEPGWHQDVTALNDSFNGDFHKNHVRAFDMAVEKALRSGLVTIKTRELCLAGFST